jgi:site-specific DNA recombinase
LPNFNTEQVWLLAKRKGLKCSKSNFRVAIRNPIYCGKIFTPAYKNEPAKFVYGQHEALVSEALFQQAWDAIDGRKRKSVTKVVSEDKLPLKGFLLCPKCNKALTGSASKGRSDFYYYYRCTSACGFRVKAEVANLSFEKEIKKYTPHPAVAALFKLVVKDANKQSNNDANNQKRKYLNQIEGLNSKIRKSRELLLSGDIDASDYQLIKF